MATKIFTHNIKVNTIEKQCNSTHKTPYKTRNASISRNNSGIYQTSGRHIDIEQDSLILDKKQCSDKKIDDPIDFNPYDAIKIRSKSEYQKKSPRKLPKLGIKITGIIQEEDTLNSTINQERSLINENKYTREHAASSLLHKIDQLDYHRVKQLLYLNHKKSSRSFLCKKKTVIDQIWKNKINSKKATFGRPAPIEKDKITYTRESLEKLADTNSMRYFDSYKQFRHEYHQVIVAGLLAPSDRLKFRYKCDCN